MIIASLLVALAHGSNDVANSISPLLNILRFYSLNEDYGFIIGGVGIAFGLLALGKRTMATVGEKVIKLDFQKGFSA